MSRSTPKPHLGEIFAARATLCDLEEAIELWDRRRPDAPVPQINRAGRDSLESIARLTEDLSRLHAALMSEVDDYGQAFEQHLAIRQAERDVQVW